MRLFVAVWPSEAALAEVAELVERVRPLAPDLSWARPEQWHLTLTFLSDVAEDALPELQARLARAAHRHRAMTLSLAGGGRFGDRVLWTRVQGDREQLRQLAASTAAAARRTGIHIEDRPYRPHFTLARGRGRADLRPLVEALGSFAGQPWAARELQLVRSRLGKGPGRTAAYDTVTAWPLRETG
jgi:2'-5' RNA ligase